MQIQGSVKKENFAHLSQQVHLKRLFFYKMFNFSSYLPTQDYIYFPVRIESGVSI